VECTISKHVKFVVVVTVSSVVAHQRRPRSGRLSHLGSFGPLSYLGPAVCLFGLIGNALNLVVLTRRRLQHSMDGLERSVKWYLNELVSGTLSEARARRPRRV